MPSSVVYPRTRAGKSKCKKCHGGYGGHSGEEEEDEEQHGNGTTIGWNGNDESGAVARSMTIMQSVGFGIAVSLAMTALAALAYRKQEKPRNWTNEFSPSSPPADSIFQAFILVLQVQHAVAKHGQNINYLIMETSMAAQFPNHRDEQGDDDNLTTGELIGIIFGGLALTMAVVAIAVWRYTRTKRAGTDVAVR
ncbi:hypothetical protein MKZ38_001841 [Zalerion maritima]|uniref:Uncharacterized protein n=1 Tax=Zalerion maritima TaxID=339359 RepID=A0AAD5WSX6_9PEZI|nr:hypothetical protein MKZ38_001841 [Zalerion maritima]